MKCPVCNDEIESFDKHWADKHEKVYGYSVVVARTVWGISCEEKLANLTKDKEFFKCPTCGRLIPSFYACPWCENNSAIFEDMDMFDFMFGLQKGFQRTYKERFKFTKFLSSIALLVESLELMLKTPYKGDKSYKWWSNKPVPDHAQRVEELVDVFHFFMLYMIKEKITPEELFTIYLAKLKVNYERQESGTY
jgi:hypothetical protein